MSMKLGLIAFSLLLTTLNAAAAPGELPESKEGIRFDAHQTGNGYSLVARGRPEQSLQILEAAFMAGAKALCPEAEIASDLRKGEYEYLEGGDPFLMPVAGAHLSISTYNLIRSAPLLAGAITCRSTESTQQIGTPESSPRLAVVSTLSPTFAYIDQGFASFNRERLDVPMAGATVEKIVNDAVKEGLAQRGYYVRTASPDVGATGQIIVSPAAIPGERFEGIALLTKIGLLGLQNLSAAFCGLEVAIQPAMAGSRMPIGGVSTRQMLPAIYSSWKQDMSDGPKESIHAKVSALLSTTLATNVRAAIHAMPTKAIALLLAPKSP